MTEEEEDAWVASEKRKYQTTHRMHHIDAAGYIVLPHGVPANWRIHAKECKPNQHEAWLAFLRGETNQ